MGTSSFTTQLKLLRLSPKEKAEYFHSDEFAQAVVERGVNTKLSLMRKYWLVEMVSAPPSSS